MPHTIVLRVTTILFLVGTLSSLGRKFYLNGSLLSGLLCINIDLLMLSHCWVYLNLLPFSYLQLDHNKKAYRLDLSFEERFFGPFLI